VRRSQELLGLENQPGSHDLKSAVSVIHQAEISPLHK